MTAMKPSSNGDQCRMTGMKEMLLERERLEQALKERFSKEVTILFSDVCGYTQFTEHRGDIQSRTLLLKHNRMVLPAIETNRGKVKMKAKLDGDTAITGSPVSFFNIWSALFPLALSSIRISKLGTRSVLRCSKEASSRSMLGATSADCAKLP